MLAAAEREDVAGLVLWDPILDGRAYLKELAADQRRSAAVMETDTDLGSVPEALGFPLTSDLSASIGRVSLAAVSRRPAPHILVIDSRPEWRDLGISHALTRLGARVETRHLPGPPIWTDQQTALVSPSILQSIVAWTIETFP
jgi:hypothetical protein